MRFDSYPRRIEIMIRHAKFLCRLLNNGGNFRVMNVANVREQVMFDLKIQAACPPRQKPIAVRKICGRFHLVNSPSIINIAVGIGYGVFGFFYHVRQLENNRHSKPRNEVR